MDKYVALIGLGVVGSPLANSLFKAYDKDFILLSSEDFLHTLVDDNIYINGELFNPRIVSKKTQLDRPIGTLFICVKNYHVAKTIEFLKTIIDEETTIVPLQNGVYSYDLFCKHFPNNLVLEGFAQGPNTQIIGGNSFVYQKPGLFHIGTSNQNRWNKAEKVFFIMKDAGVEVYLDKDIRKQVWKKMMLNVAGNAVTALTDLDYCMLIKSKEAQLICRRAMEEFILVAKTKNIELSYSDIEDVFDYFFSFKVSKKTSMLEDVTKKRPTENDFLAGYIRNLAIDEGISTPYINSLYCLIKTKEDVYLNKLKGKQDGLVLFPDEGGVDYSPQLKRDLLDIDNKLNDKEYARLINSGNTPELHTILEYAIQNTKYYSRLPLDSKLSDFPVMNKSLLNANYNDILVHYYDDKPTHKMHTSGSTGIPFTVVQNLEKRSRHIADLKYFGAFGGYIDHEPMCYLRAKPTASKESQERDNVFQLDICNLSADNLTKYYHFMCEKKCVALIAYPSTLTTAVDFWSKHFENQSSIRVIFSTSETLTEETRIKLRKFFGDKVYIYARYSNTEQGILGQEFFGGNMNEYALNWASFYFEILKFDSNQQAGDGELGRVVITDLYNKAFPLIRYDTGDVAIMRKRSADSLPYFSELYGRRMDLIFDENGEPVSPFLLCRIMRLTKNIKQWQFIQNSEHDYLLKISKDADIDLDLTNELTEFQKTLGQKSSISVEFVDEIPVLNSMKRKLIVSNYKK